MEDFFHAGGAIPEDKWATYVEREADEELYKRLSVGDFCYILTARQMGKTSLSNRISHRLKKEGVKCIYIELNQSGRNATEEEWYFSFTEKIYKGSGFEIDFDKWWESQEKYPPIERFSNFVDLLVKSVDHNLVIFIDEIDVFLSFRKFDTDDFFAVIRSLHSERMNDKRYKKITFVLIGVAAPGDLMKDAERTPFNVGQPIFVDYLDMEKAYPKLSKGFEGSEEEKRHLIEEVFYWTKGQPYLTQAICKKLAEENSAGYEKKIVRKIVDRIIASDREIISGHMENIQDRILYNMEFNLAMLSCYHKILSENHVNNIASDPAQIYLRLTGLVKEQDGQLVISNPIYQKFFNSNWVDKSFEVINPYYPYLKRWLINKKEADADHINSDQLKDYKAWAFAPNSPATKEDLQFVSDHSDLLYQKSALLYQKKIRRRSIREMIITVAAFIAVGYLGIRFTQLFNIQKQEQEARKQEQVDRQKLKNSLNSINNELFTIFYSNPEVDLDTVKINSLIEGIKEQYKDSVNNQLINTSIESQRFILYYIADLKRQIRSMNIEVDSLKILVNENPKSPPIKYIAPIPKAVLIPICDRMMEHPLYQSGDFYRQLTNRVQQELRDKVRIISSSQVERFIEKEGIDICKSKYRSKELGVNLGAEIGIVMDFGVNNIKLIFLNISGTGPYAENKDITYSNIADVKQIQNELIKQISKTIRD